MWYARVSLRMHHIIVRCSRRGDEWTSGLRRRFPNVDDKSVFECSYLFDISATLLFLFTYIRYISMLVVSLAFVE